MQAVYFVQGGYYQKSFGKHGPHTHPYTYGHFFGLPIQGSQVRLVHQWILYESGAMESLEGKFCWRQLSCQSSACPERLVQWK